MFVLFVRSLRPEFVAVAVSAGSVTTVTRNYVQTVPVCIQGVPGGMDNTSGECSLC